jgi:ribosomal protein S18 acetylase RimI-like enzyme
MVRERVVERLRDQLMSSSENHPVTVRPFESRDLEVVKQITVEAFSGVSIDEAAELIFGSINGHDWKWRKARHIDADVAREVDGILVVESDQGEVVGYITSWQDTEAGIGYIPNLAFVPGWRGRGLGRKLIELALERFREAGLTLAKIETLAQNDVGHHLYTSIGFREVARQSHFFMDLQQASTADEPTGEPAVGPDQDLGESD